MKKIDAKKIETRITAMLRRYFEDIKIIATHIAQDFDRDGEEILRIQVVFEGILKEADVRRVPGVAHHIRPVLAENDADLFPLLSFVSKLDYDRGRGRRASPLTSFSRPGILVEGVEEGQALREANLRRACSTAYYAIFHTLCETCATLLIRRSGGASTPGRMFTPATIGTVKAKCKQADMIGRFPAGVQDFAGRFLTMQEKRHRADYEPCMPFSLSEVEADIEAASAAIETFCAVPERDRRAFAAFILLGKPRGY